MNDKSDKESVDVLLTVVVEHDPSCPAHPDNVERASNSKPAKVNSKQFRDNYDGIFGKMKVGSG